MTMIQSVGGIWVDDTTIQVPSSTGKSWQDVIYAVVDNRLEVWDIEKKDPYKSNYTINRAVNLIASNVAQVPLLIYNKNNDVVENDYVNSIFNAPNSETSNFELWEQTVISLYNRGEAFWYLNTNEHNVIKDMFVLDPKFMKHFLDKDTGMISKWVFNDKIPMEVNNVIHFKASGSGKRGFSLLNTIVIELSSDEQAAQFSNSYFKNGAKLGGIITTDKDVEITSAELAKVIDKFNATHQGSNKSYKVAGLLGGLKYQEMTTSLKDMDFLQSRKDIRDKIMVLLGVNPTVMGLVENVNLANAQMAMRQFIELTILPLLIRLQQKLNATLFNNHFKGYTCKFDKNSIEALQEDIVKQLEAAKTLLSMGYTRNEINTRLTLDLPDTDDNLDLLPLNTKLRSDLFKPKEPKTVKLIDKDVIDSKVNKDIEVFMFKKFKTFFYKQRCKLLELLSKSNDINNFIDNEVKSFDNFVVELFKSISMSNDMDLSDDYINSRLVDIKSINSFILKGIEAVIYNDKKINSDIDNIKSIYNKNEKLLNNVVKYELNLILNKE